MRYWLILCIYLLGNNAVVLGQELYKKPEGTQVRWSSFENIKAKKNAGGQENNQAKGHAFQDIDIGETITLMETNGTGIITRIWMTINKRDPKTLRSLKLEMYWDGEDKPAVSVPLGDFFGNGLSKLTPFESALFSNPEGRSFNCMVPMPFKTGARVILTNESTSKITLFYDISFLKKASLEEDVLYFHTYWNRDIETTLGEDYEILPKIDGSGRFLGVNIGINTHEQYKDSWWGEGEVKMYLDGDDNYPTLVGTGTEDYIGTAWGQGEYNHQYQGCLVADSNKGTFTFYRYHVPDPIYFEKNIKVTIQQIGGWQKEKLIEIVDQGANLIPISVAGEKGFVKLLEDFPNLKLSDPDFPEGWVNFYRQDDVSSTAYFYLDTPSSNLPELKSLKIRSQNVIRD